MKKILFIAGIIIILVLVFLLFLLPNHDSKIAAEEFLSLYYTVSNSNIYQNMNQSGDPSQIETILYTKYGNAMTDKALQNAIANRFILEGEKAADEWKCTLEVKKVTLKSTEKQSDSIKYDYTVNAQVMFSDGSIKDISPNGQLKLIKEGDKWKVDLFYTKIGALYEQMSK